MVNNLIISHKNASLNYPILQTSVFLWSYNRIRDLILNKLANYIYLIDQFLSKFETCIEKKLIIQSRFLRLTGSLLDWFLIHVKNNRKIMLVLWTFIQILWSFSLLNSLLNKQKTVFKNFKSLINVFKRSSNYHKTFVKNFKRLNNVF